MTLKERLEQLLSRNGIIDIVVIPQDYDEEPISIPITMRNVSVGLNAGVLVVVTDVAYLYDFRYPEQSEQAIVEIAHAMVEAHNELVDKVQEIAIRGRETVRQLNRNV